MQIQQISCKVPPSFELLGVFTRKVPAELDFGLRHGEIDDMRSSAIAAILGWGIFLTAVASGAKEPLEGTWVGQWVRDGSALDVTLSFSRSERGYEGSFDSAALRVTGIPIQNDTWNPPDVSWQVIGDATTTIFSGQLRGNAIAGGFTEQ